MFVALLRLAMINKDMEKFIEHEVRIRILEEVAKDIRDSIKNMNTKIDSHFLWIIGLVFVSIFIPVLLHSLKLV